MNVDKNLQELNEMLDAQLTEFRYGYKDAGRDIKDDIKGSAKALLGLGAIGASGYGGYRAADAIMKRGGIKKVGASAGRYVGQKAGKAGSYVRKNIPTQASMKKAGTKAGAFAGDKASKAGDFLKQKGGMAKGKLMDLKILKALLSRGKA